MLTGLIGRKVLIVLASLATMGLAASGLEAQSFQPPPETPHISTISKPPYDKPAKPSGKGAARHSANKLAKVHAVSPADFELAKKSFPFFCDQWAKKLEEREHQSLHSIKWELREGWQTGYYVGYSKIKTCSCSESTHGQPIGALTYDEVHYYLVGHSIDEAQHAEPQPIGKTETTELFRWDKNRWSYQ